MSLTVTYKGKISRLESTATSAWVQVPQPDQTLTRFGATIEGVLNLRPGYDLPYELALFSLLRDAAVNNRNVDLQLTLHVIDILHPGIPPGTPIPIPDENVDKNFPFDPNHYIYTWSCDRAIVGPQG